VPLRYLAQDLGTSIGMMLNKAHELFHQDEFENELIIYKELHYYRYRDFIPLFTK
jgi:hypothetical protein